MPEDRSANQDLKVLFAVFQTSDLANGGVNSITEIIRYLPGQHIVATQLETPANKAWQAAGVETLLLKLSYRSGESFAAQNFANKIRWLNNIFSNNLRVLRLLRSQRIQVVHCNDPAPFWHVVPAAKLLRIPVVLNLRDTKSQRERVKPNRYRNKFKLVSAVLVLSHEMAEFYANLVGKDWLKRCKIRIEFIYSIVNFEAQSPSLSANYTQEINEDSLPSIHQWSIAVVATFNDKKNQLEFIQHACRRIVELNPGVKICFVGDFHPDCNPYAQKCLDAAEQLGLLSHIEFAGYQADMLSRYHQFDLVVVPSRKEGLARCMIESLASGTPVVSFDVCSAREILETHHCGKVVPQGNYSSMVDAITQLLRDQDRRKQMSHAAKNAAKRLFSKETVLQQYIQLYSSVAK